MFEIVPETGSTNADLLARLHEGERLQEGHWLRAERQTGGRGRLGRAWESPKGNLHCSTAVNLRPADHAASSLSLIAGLAVHDCVKRSLLDHTPMLLKWPNDLLIREAKVAGILLERQGDAVIVGIGINVSHAPEIPGRKTTHLGYENGRFANDPQSVLDMLADHFATRLTQWRELPLSHTVLEWAIRSHRFDDRLRVIDANGDVLHGSYRGITPDGGMRIQPVGGPEQIVQAGDVSLLWHDDEKAEQ